MLSPGKPIAKTYRIDFALVILTGNVTRYKILRPKVEADKEVVSRWYPIRTWFAEDPLRILPIDVRLRLRHLLDSWQLYVRRPAQAVIIHAFETYYLLTYFYRMLGRRTVIVVNPDGILNIGNNSLSARLYHYAVRHTDLFIPWSKYAADGMKANYPYIPDSKILTFHPGINIEQWPMREPKEPGERFKLLFVGGDGPRKGLATLVDAFERSLHAHCDLDIATQSGYLPPELKERITRLPHTRLFLDLQSGSDELKALYRECDTFVLPTKGDTSSWVGIESLCTGIPVIITNVGGIPEIIIDGETGLNIPPNDPDALVVAVERLRTSPALRHKLICQGRAHIEANFNANINTPRMLAAIKELIDRKQVR